ncbi:hypothetical protein HBH98_159270 [Parastagonospora nodorum]|nr:hypothetical protein HBH53_041010 [Parastagonospora nodorum]KAH3976188.1 hypothetical protein HBH52_117470 [Parastagonospora nodorum]KAH3984320.1 hypothetical protein HBH51_031170 [Parastagonospora nodorum]KAH4052138.1 hypothetical protein HBH49_112430 [Parastagonospora nodorum]KAH4102733.1 hypothetical protein HBH46_122460 [Parastagonospora nodorum]
MAPRSTEHIAVLHTVPAHIPKMLHRQVLIENAVFWPFGRCKLLSHIGVFNLYGDVYVNILKLDWVVDFGNICISRLVHFGGSLEHQGVCKLDSLAYSRGLERGRFNHFRLLDRFVYMYTVKLSRFDHYERYCYVYPIFHVTFEFF